MNNENVITGQDIKLLMKKSNLSANELAKKLGCRKQTIYNWRSDYLDKPIRGKYRKPLLELIRQMLPDLEGRYRKALKDFIQDSTRSIVFWRFMKQIGLKEEVFVPPRLRREGLDAKIWELETLLIDWDEHPRPKLIQASSGFGKTTMVRMAALSLLELQESLPIVIPLGLFPGWLKENSCGDFMSFIGYVLRRLSLDQLEPAVIFKKIQEGTALLLLDGIDEIPPSMQSKFIGLLERVTIVIPGAKRIIITSRPLDITTVARLKVICDFFELSSFDETQIVCLAKQILQEHQVEAFLQAVTEHTSVRSLVSKPFVLSILLTMFAQANSLELTEAAAIEELVNHTFGKYHGARSLGGYVEREHSLKYIITPVDIKTSIFYICYTLRRKHPHGVGYSRKEFLEQVASFWLKNGSVPKEHIEGEFEAFLLYLTQLGIISNNFNNYDNKSNPDIENIIFTSEVLMDWMAAAHLVADQSVLESEFSEFAKGHKPLPPSHRRQLFYALELASSIYGNKSLVDNLLINLYAACYANDHPSEQLLHIRFIFLVDCLRRGIVGPYQLKRDIRRLFLSLFETNDYALIQRELQLRKDILNPGKEYDLKDESNYVNVFAAKGLPPAWSKEDIKGWHDKILDDRFNDYGKDHYRDKNAYEQEMEWRHNQTVEALLNRLETLKIKSGNLGFPRNLKLYRRSMFSARFVHLKGPVKQLDKVFEKLLWFCDDARRQDPMVKFMALDSLWCLLRRVRTIIDILSSHPLSQLDLAKYESKYFTLAKEHEKFKNKYCLNSEWDADKLINDDSAQAHYLIVEHQPIVRNLVGTIENKLPDYIRELKDLKIDMQEDFTKQLLNINANRIAKLFISLSLYCPLNNEDLHKTIAEALSGFANLTNETGQACNVGPRQLYDYAVFSLWCLYEYEKREADILPF